MGRAIQTLLFDFGGTLDADGVAWKERFHDHYLQEGLGLDADAFAPVFYAADDPLVGTTDQDADLAAVVRMLTANIETEIARRGDQGASSARAARVADRFLEETGQALRRNRPALEALKARYRLGVVSNFYGNLPSVCRATGIDELFDAIVDSEQVGARKPEAAIFEAALKPAGGAAGTALMVGDSLHRDRAGAQGAGLQFVWIATPEAQAQRTRSEGPAPHPVIERLDQLADMLL